MADGSGLFTSVTGTGILLRNRRGQVLLGRGTAPPTAGQWRLPGGKTEGGESFEETAVRELAEETGIVVEASALGEPVESSTVEFSWSGYAVVQGQTFFAVGVGDAAVSLDGLEAIEKATTISYRWWSGDELEASGDAYPDGLPALLRLAAESLVDDSYR